MRKLHTKRYNKQVPGHQIQVDVKFLTFKGKSGEKVWCFQYTAIDDATRVRALKIYEKRTQANAINFIDHIIEKFPFRICESLRTVRTAIDSFHSDWTDGDIAKSDAAASENGFPVTLQDLVDGVSGASAEAGFLRYLRRIPRNPFVRGAVELDEQWLYIGYMDAPDAARWNGQDVYDLRAKTEKLALDGSQISDW